MSITLEGRALTLGDDVNTDYIISSSRKKQTLDPHALKQYLFESLDPALAAGIRPGDVFVAGKNFGCGSAMEVSVTAVLAAGVRAVLARTFARTYYRNAINNGLVPIECDTAGIPNHARLRISLDQSGIRVLDDTRGCELVCHPLPAIMLDILGEGGLVPYMRRHGGYANV